MGLIICIMGVYVPMVSSFRKSKKMVTKNREFPFMKHYSLPSCNPNGHLKVNDISQIKRTLAQRLQTCPKICAKFQISSFTRSYQTRYFLKILLTRNMVVLFLPKHIICAICINPCHIVHFYHLFKKYVSLSQVLLNAKSVLLPLHSAFGRSFFVPLKSHITFFKSISHYNRFLVYGGVYCFSAEM